MALQMKPFRPEAVCLQGRSKDSIQSQRQVPSLSLIYDTKCGQVTESLSAAYPRP